MALVAGGVFTLVAMYAFNGYWTAAMAAGIAFAVTFLSFTVSTGDGGVLCLGQAGIAALGAIVAGRLSSDAGLPLVAQRGHRRALRGGLRRGARGRRNPAGSGGLRARHAGLRPLLPDVRVQPQALIPLAGVNYPVFKIGGLNQTQSAILLGAILFAALAALVIWFRQEPVRPGVRRHPRQSDGRGEPRRQRARLPGRRVRPRVGDRRPRRRPDRHRAGQHQHGDFALLTGLVWLAVVVTIGVRGYGGALVGGLMFAIAPAAFEFVHINGFGNLTTVLFGLGAVGIAREPRGFLAQMGGDRETDARPEPPRPSRLRLRLPVASR